MKCIGEEGKGSDEDANNQLDQEKEDIDCQHDTDAG